MTLIRLRGGTSAEWAAADPVLRARECGVDVDEHKLKVGDGVLAWSQLPWSEGTAGLPVGGATGQVLAKVTDYDFDVDWVDDDTGISVTFGAEPVAPTGGDIWIPTTTQVTITRSVQAVATNTTLDDTDWLTICDAACTITLPAALDRGGREYIVKSRASGVVTIEPDLYDTIDGQSTIDINQWESLSIVSDGDSEWVIT